MCERKESARSEKSQEKCADQYMTVSTSIFTAVMVGILVVPLNEMIKASVDLSDNATSFTYIKFRGKTLFSSI